MSLKKERPDLIVWPETAVPGLIENDAGLRSRLALLARRHDLTLVVGGIGVSNIMNVVV